MYSNVQCILYCWGKALASLKYERVGVIARLGGESVEDSVEAVARVLDAAGVEAIYEAPAAATLSDDALRIAGREALGDQCDLIVVVGGDGSLLGVGRDLSHKNIPVLGVNRGGLGFLAGVAPEDIEEDLADVLHGECVEEAHFLLEAVISRNGQEVARSPALNDVVVHSAGRSHMLEVRVWIDDQWVYDQRGDGLIIASPTGSTAYSLSAGGPIMHPALDAIAIVPMFPHTLTSRPLVVQGGSRIRVTVENADAIDAQVNCDSQVNFDLGTGAELHVEKYPEPMTLLYPKRHSFYESCRSKLDWATRLGDR